MRGTDQKRQGKGEEGVEGARKKREERREKKREGKRRREKEKISDEEKMPEIQSSSPVPPA